LIQFGGYNGPSLGEHFCQRSDNMEGAFYLCAAPSTFFNKGYPEAMVIKIERNWEQEPDYRSTFSISAEMWRDGRWREPKFTDQWPDTVDSKPKYKIRLEEQHQRKIGEQDRR
jgi:hypothetical protein